MQIHNPIRRKGWLLSITLVSTVLAIAPLVGATALANSSDSTSQGTTIPAQLGELSLYEVAQDDSGGAIGWYQSPKGLGLAKVTAAPDKDGAIRYQLATARLTPEEKRSAQAALDGRHGEWPDVAELSARQQADQSTSRDREPGVGLQKVTHMQSELPNLAVVSGLHDGRELVLCAGEAPYDEQFRGACTTLLRSAGSQPLYLLAGLQGGAIAITERNIAALALHSSDTIEQGQLVATESTTGATVWYFSDTALEREVRVELTSTDGSTESMALGGG